MKKWAFLMVCIVLNMHASNKKFRSKVESPKHCLVAEFSEVQDKKKLSYGGYVAYNPEPIFTLPKPSRHVRFLPDGETIVTNLGNEVCLYPVKKKGGCELLGEESWISAIDCDGQSLLATATDRSKIILWNLKKTYAQQAQWNEKGITQTCTIKFDREGKRIAIGDLHECKMALCAVETQQELFDGYIDKTCDYVKDIVWSHDNSTLALYQPGGQPKISLLDTREKKSVAEITVENRNTFGSPQIVCTADDTIIWNDRCKIKAWDRKTQKTRDVAIISKEQQRVYNHYTSLALSHDDRVLAALFLKNRCDFLDWRTGEILQSLPLEINDNHCVTFSPQSDMIATASTSDSWQYLPQPKKISVYEREKEKRSE
jgi:WD40 repeat protein